ncbi:hypothetical protein [Erwinia mallotivora]|uniref:N-acetylmuramoyl-L-alanine amidase n=1 Tax=Erwinia mallotivora TaxID=69222 RepID=A0A014MCG5_9GAMM|nr:hypothetical protein [Erwinia mallotivora]EXU75744.1 hypothetical protein BG55_10680 [Erwinia mallotivora]
MLFIDKNGMTDAERIVKKRFTTIERQDLNQINGIVVHQTSSSTHPEIARKNITEASTAKW